MRRPLTTVLLVTMLVGGCSRSIPASIKTEIDFLHTVVSTAVDEVEAIEDDAERAEKAVRALKRAEPHTETLKDWVDGEDDDD